MDKDFFAATAELLQNPSVQGWEIEIRRVLNGEREHALLRSGSSDEYVGSMLARAPDPARSETLFREALDRVVSGWQPSTPARPYQMAHMLGLVAAYVPDSGAEKILAQLTEWDRFDRTVPDVEDWPEYGDLHMRALVALAAYFPAPPLERERAAAYAAHLRIFRNHLFQAAYAGFAASRLLRLGALELEGNELDPLISRTGTIIGPVVAAVLAPIRWHGRNANEDEARRQLSLIFQSCQRTGQRRAFWSAVAEVDGCRGMDTGDGVAVRCGDETIINLNVLPPAPEKNLPATWNTRPRDFKVALSALLARQPEAAA